MASLIILGNLNQATFANSILAANEKSRELYKHHLNRIFVVHSVQSEASLNDKKDWLNHIKKNAPELDPHEIYHKTIDWSASEESIQKFVEYLDFVIKGVGNSDEFIVDLTNGTSVQKNLLSIGSFILDLEHQFMIDIALLKQQIKGLPVDSSSFLESTILAKSYVKTPKTTTLDNLAYLDLTEIVRYKRKISSFGKKFSVLSEFQSDDSFFKENLLHSIRLKMEGDQKKSDNAMYRIAASSMSASLEELISHMYLFSDEISQNEKDTFGTKVRKIENILINKQPKHFDTDFLKLFNDFMLYLRNSTTHKGNILTDLERFKADLTMKMAFPFLSFYMDLVFPVFKKSDSAKNQTVQRLTLLNEESYNEDEEYFFGIDGDDTGKILEELFILYGNDKKRFKKTSSDIKKGVKKIYDRVKKKKGEIIFEAGDDLLFKGKFSFSELRDIQKVYFKDTNGQTCSIAYGKTLYATFVAMKMAKAQPGKNAIIGIDIPEFPPPTEK